MSLSLGGNRSHEADGMAGTQYYKKTFITVLLQAKNTEFNPPLFRSIACKTAPANHYFFYATVGAAHLSSSKVGYAPPILALFYNLSNPLARQGSRGGVSCREFSKNRAWGEPSPKGGLPWSRLLGRAGTPCAPGRGNAAKGRQKYSLGCWGVRDWGKWVGRTLRARFLPFQYPKSTTPSQIKKQKKPSKIILLFFVGKCV